MYSNLPFGMRQEFSIPRSWCAAAAGDEDSDSDDSDDSSDESSSGEWDTLSFRSGGLRSTG